MSEEIVGLLMRFPRKTRPSRRAELARLLVRLTGDSEIDFLSDYASKSRPSDILKLLSFSFAARAFPTSRKTGPTQALTQIPFHE
jgi:hypothetical protein